MLKAFCKQEPFWTFGYCFNGPALQKVKMTVFCLIEKTTCWLSMSRLWNSPRALCLNVFWVNATNQIVRAMLSKIQMQLNHLVLQKIISMNNCQSMYLLLCSCMFYCKRDIILKPWNKVVGNSLLKTLIVFLILHFFKKERAHRALAKV